MYIYLYIYIYIYDAEDVMSGAGGIAPQPHRLPNAGAAALFRQVIYRYRYIYIYV